MILLAFLVPGNIVLPGPLKSNGAPANLVSLVCLGLAVAGLFLDRRWTRRAAPAPATAEAPTGSLRLPAAGVGLLLYLAGAVVLYGVALAGPLTRDETAGALRSLVSVFGAAGVALYVWALVRTRADRHRLAACIVAGGAFSAVVSMLGLVGLLPGWVDVVRGLGLVENTRTLREVVRFDVLRSRGTAEHPIEYSVGLALALPFALHLARHSLTRSGRVLAVLATVLIVVGIPLAVSRSGVLGLAVGLAVAVSAWRPAEKLGVLLVAVLGSVAAWLAFPTTIAAVVDAFTLAQEDNSVTGRLDDYAVVDELFREHPWLGLGAGVYRPETGGVFLDNTWLGTLVGGGIVGCVVLALLFLLPAAQAWDAGVVAEDEVDRSFSRTLLAALAVVLLTTATSDMFSFQQATVVLMVVVGLLAAPPPIPGAVRPLVTETR
ncbi:O-antigen ligase family protein [Kineococcus gynurae]|uniref:O-antigen ligase family protein n=1 Tax=Kineococcus gynurae TaxID=452979 RepID=UPI0036D38A28